MIELKKTLIRNSSLLLLMTTVACGGTLSSGSPKTSHNNTVGQLVRTSDDGMGDEVEAGGQNTGSHRARMNGVEYYISQELGHENAGSASPDSVSVGSSFDAGIWRPKRGYDIPVVRNAQVEKWIGVFTGPLRSNYERWLTRASYYAPLMEDILHQYNLPHDLIYLSMIESGFNLNAYSSAAAAGPWQFIGSTGREYGLQSGKLVDERRDLTKATQAAAAHLRDLYKLYGDWYLAFAAYNAGAGAVNRAIQKAGTRDFWALSAPKSRVLRQETKDYVPRILAAAIIAKNYRKFGFSPEIFDKPLNFAAVTVPDATDVSAIARCAGVSVDEVKTLNTSLVMGITPPGQNYTVHLPKGTEDAFRQNYAKLPKSERLQCMFHRVTKRETIATISKKYGLSRNTLASLNHLQAKARVEPGQVLMIPSKGARALKNFHLNGVESGETTVASAPTIPAPEEASRMPSLLKKGTLVAAEAAGPASAPVVATKTIAAKTYRVARGDTLSSVASKHGVTVAELRSLNGLKGKAGQVIKLSPKQIVEVAKAAPVAEKVEKVVAVNSAAVGSHKVGAGETLSSIASRNGTTVASLMAANHLRSARLQRGQVIKLGVAKAAAPSVVAAAPAPAAKKATVVASNNKVIFHQVRRGETLWDLAKKYNVPVDMLKKWNRLTRNQLYPKQRLKIIAETAVKPGKVALN